MLRLATTLALVSACYAPNPSDCAYSCANDVGCPSGLTCNAGMCRAAGASGACGATTDAPIGDGRIDAVAFDAPTTCTLDDILFVNIARNDLASPSSAWTISAGQTYDTDTGIGTGTIPPSKKIGNVRLIYVTSFTVPSTRTLTITGSLPLVIAAQTTMDVKGGIRWTPFHGTDTAGNCPAISTPGVGTCGGGGAAGGTGGTIGGAGGDGTGPVATMFGAGTPSAGGQAGMSKEAANVEPLSEGCQGAAGPTNNGGGGGGGLELVAPSIAVTGAISVAGGGGDQGSSDPTCPLPGAGGGAGGGLVLNACSVTTSIGSLLCASGGGGGGGGTAAPGNPGHGANGDAAPAQGGQPFGCGGGTGGAPGGSTNKGGDGATFVGRGEVGGSGQTVQAEAGGGGGGGTGRIRIEAGFIQHRGMSTPAASTN